MFYVVYKQILIKVNLNREMGHSTLLNNDDSPYTGYTCTPFVE